MSSVSNRLKELRESRGIAASDLARSAGVTRQAIHAIEAGAYLPNTEVALRLARELEVPFENLFALKQERENVPKPLATTVLSAQPPVDGQLVRSSQVGSRRVSVPVSAMPYYMPEADGSIHAGKLRPFTAPDANSRSVVIAGCDPAMNLLARMVERAGGAEVICAAASSRLALRWLADGKTHIAGMHLEDERTGEFNTPMLRKQFPAQDLCVVTFARWEEGLVIAPGNPKSVRGVEDLARRNMTFVNREPGSGSRALLDRLLKKAGIASARVEGYERIAYGHLAAAWCVSAGTADACLATGAAARAFGLDFIPLHTARYDLAMRRQTSETPAVQALLDVLQRSALRRKLEALAGYDTSQTGATVAAQ